MRPLPCFAYHWFVANDMTLISGLLSPLTSLRPELCHSRFQWLVDNTYVESVSIQGGMLVHNH